LAKVVTLTETQFKTLISAISRLERQIQAIEERVAFVYPTPSEMRRQIDRELESILAPGGGLKVFAEE
jgi:hypothetical protein